jgi:hypothetical protein
LSRRIGRGALALNPLGRTKGLRRRAIANLRRNPTVREVEVDCDRRPRRRRMNQRLAGSVGDSDEPSLQRLFGMGQLRKSPQRSQPLAASLDAIAKQPPLQPWRYRSKVRACVCGSLSQRSRQPLARIVQALG